jgi:hypothetical protein
MLFGIRLPVNFRSPYQATSIIDFWRRWHITLSRFLRDYLYIPLGGNRLGKRRRYWNLLLTMLLGGLWHGAGWNFVVWGGLHGVYLGINHLWRSWSIDASAYNEPIRGLSKMAGWAATFFAVVIAWVFFRAGTMAGALQMLFGLFGRATDNSAYVPLGIVRVMDLPILLGGERLLLAGGAAVALALIIALAMPNVPQIFRYREYRHGPEPAAFVCWRPNAAWALVVAIALAIALFAMWQRLEFLYFQF